MKSPKLVLASIALCMSLAAFSQTDTTKTKKDTTTKRDTTAAIQQATSNASVQETQATNNQQTQSANGQQPATLTTSQTHTTSQESTPKPNFGRYYIPVIGSYQSTQSTGDNKSVTITGDESNPGKVWIEGLGSTKFYALLKAVPGTYKVPVQKVDDMNIQEGTVLYDENSKQIDICLGCGYKDANPSEALTSSDASATTTEKEVTAKHGKHATVKTKVKTPTVITFKGTKSEGTASLNQ